MKTLSSLILISFLVSCASGPKKKGSKDLSEIKQEDFKKVTQVGYRKADDQFNNVKSEYSEALNYESLERIFKYDGGIELSGDMGRVAKLCYEGNFSDAFELIKITNKKYLKNPIFWNQVGTCYLLKRERRKALLFFNKALAIKGNYSPALNNLGIMYFYEADYPRAMVAFKRAKRYKEFSRTPRYNLANLYLNFGLYDKAITELNVLYRVAKKDIDVLSMMGTAHLMKGNPKAAVGYFKAISESDFLERADIGLNYAMALYMSNNKDDAKDAFKDVEKKNLGLWKGYYSEVKNYIGVK